MADVSKAQKLASARKKFKELKKEKKKNAATKVNETTESPPTSREHTPVESVNAVQEALEATQLPNYFSNVDYNGYQQPVAPVAFFDTFIQNGEHATSAESPLANVFLNDHSNDEKHASQDLEVASNSEINTENKPEIVSPVQVQEVTVPEPSKINEEVQNFYMFGTVKLEEKQQPSQLSSIESLRQISEQMAEFINPTSESTSAVIESQLETRNQELAAFLSQEKVKSEGLAATLTEYQAKLSELEKELKQKNLQSDSKNEHELNTLREQLQYHIQTVGILVAEKTELVGNLSQFQLSAKQKSEECEELQGRLKTSRSRVADLEREILLLKNEKSQFDHLGQEQKSDLEHVRNSHQMLKEERDELMQDLLEVREKLKTSSESNLVFQQQIGELSNQLSMANIKIQQLTTGEIDHVSGQVDQLTQEKFALEKQVADLSHTVKTISKEREESSLQYQQYAQQLNSQISSMASRLEKLQKENESLQIQEQNRIKHIGELEKQLQNIQSDQVNFTVPKNTGELDAALELIEKIKAENEEVQEEKIKVTNEKDMLLKELEAKAASVRQLEELIEELRGNQPDTVKLLATMESDKVAAARAVAQNTELKNQMESMTEVFMKLNNDKIELTETLTVEQRNSKELFEKLQKTELHLQTLAEAIEIKDKELQNLREKLYELEKQMLQSEQLTDRLRHYEAQDHGSHSLQNELQESKQAIAKLTDELQRLKENTKVEANQTIKDESRENGDENHTDKDEEVCELRRKLEELETTNRRLQSREESAIDSNHNDQWTVLDKESAMKHLEEKFLKTMEDIAELTEEKQRLEHLVLQLQGETETIGEYVALYQYQRSLLKQKAIEKDQQLSQLANDREHMKSKLEKLNELVKKLVLEKGALPSELLEHHENLNQDRLCEEHAKIHNEINMIAQNGLTAEGHEGDGHSTETAQQIIELLGEIKCSNLVQPTENFHHCPWCSGQLITV